MAESSLSNRLSTAMREWAFELELGLCSIGGILGVRTRIEVDKPSGEDEE
jgi:hypothetical protein